MGVEQDLTDANKETIHHLPATQAELSEKLRISKSSARDRIAALRNRGLKVPRDDNGVYHLADEEKVRRVSIKHTGTKTREANDFATSVERDLLRRMKNKPPLVASQSPAPGNEDMVLHLTDTHMGDVVEDQYGREVYNPDICEAYIEHVTQKTLDLSTMMGQMTNFDTLHVIWGGDMLTNENIYDGQAFDIQLMVKDQMARIVNALVQQVESFAGHFDTVQVVAQPGNHGKTRASGVSKQANMDLLAYRWIQDRISDKGLDNVHYIPAEATHYRTFYMRDGEWKGMVRHGQDSLQHADATAASSRDWRGWKIAHGFDIAYRGHYHQAKREPIMNQWDVIMSPSMKPGSSFAERIGQPDCSESQKLATVHGVSDDRPKTWEFVVDDADFDKSDLWSDETEEAAAEAEATERYWEN